MSSVGFLLLAAGQAKRFGSDKLMAPLTTSTHGKPLTVIESTLANLPAEYPVHCLCRPSQHQLLTVLAHHQIPYSGHEGLTAGMGASISLGVTHTQNWSGWIICLADMPYITCNTYHRIASALTDSNIVVPVIEHCGKQVRGNPVGFGREFARQLSGLTGNWGGKRIISANSSVVREIPVKDVGILLDIDYPNDINEDVFKKPNQPSKASMENRSEPENKSNTSPDSPTQEQSTITTTQGPLPEDSKVPFSSFALDARLQNAIAKMGFTECSPIQAKSLPFTLKGNDIIGKAQTGTGKTAAFLISLMQHLLSEPEQEERYNGEPRAMILAPTRELALQIEKDAQLFIAGTPITLMSVVGGMEYRKQKNRLQNEIIDILVGTPGRILDFLSNKDLFLTEIEILVIDEADRMLDMGFIPDIKKILRGTPKKEYRQTMLFSATFTDDIVNLAKNWTYDAEFVEIEPESIASANVEKKVYLTTTEEKITLLYNIITQKKLDKVIVFANRRDETRDLVEHLKRLRVSTALLSGDVPQNKRLKTLEDFRSGRIRVLVATDVAGRGIHVDGISHVVNFTLPEDPEDYVHRIGRTGRAGSSGISISFACEEDAFEIPKIESLIGEKLDYQQPEEELLTPLPPH